MRARIKYNQQSNSVCRGVAQPGSAPQWGCGGREFESRRPDHFRILILCLLFVGCAGEPDPVALFEAGNFEDAFNAFEARAKAGDAEAENYLGIHFYLGAGVERDFAQAARWFERAARHGSASAQRSLGILYLRGLGVPQDNFKAYGWLYGAYEHGVLNARDYLAQMGDTLTPGQIIQARKWVDEELGRNAD